MKTKRHSLYLRVTAALLSFICLMSLFPASVFAAGTDTIKLEKFGMSGVSYTSASLGTCTLHQMYYDYGGETAVGFCGTKGGGMGNSLIGQTWGNPQEITDPNVKLMMAYYYAHSTGTFTDQAHALGVDDVWDAGYTWYMNAWVQAILWRYQAGTLANAVEDSAEELMYVYNSLAGTHYTSIDDKQGNTSFRDRTQYIYDLGNQGVWGDCAVYEYSFTGAGSSTHPAGSVQKVVIGKLGMEGTEESYVLTIKKVDTSNPTKGLPGAKFHIEATNGSYSKDVSTGANGVVTVEGLSANTYAVTEVGAPSGYEIDNAGPEYVVLPNNGSNTVTITFTDTPVVSASGSIRKVDADDPTRGLAGSVIKIEGVDNNFTGTYTTGTGGALADVPWDTMPIGSYTATEVTPPDGYTLSSDPNKVKQDFYWDGKNDVALVFENDARVKVELIKLDEAEKPLAGAVFNIIKDGQVIGSEATDAAGRITVPNVTEGMYAFVEVSAPEGYARLTEPVIAHVDQATVNGGGTVMRRGRPALLIRPRWFCWENVPGVFSSGTPKFEDFRLVLEAVAGIVCHSVSIPGPYPWSWQYAGRTDMGVEFSMAWRVLDAQYWPSTPQRRRRVFLVADFSGRTAAKILFEQESMQRRLAENGKAGKTAAVQPGIGTGDSGSSYSTEPGAGTALSDPERTGE